MGKINVDDTFWLGKIYFNLDTLACDKRPDISAQFKQKIEDNDLANDFNELMKDVYRAKCRDAEAAESNSGPASG